jgi:hypothetical protein
MFRNCSDDAQSTSIASSTERPVNPRSTSATAEASRLLVKTYDQIHHQSRCHEYWFGLVWFGLVSLPSPDLFSLAAPVKCPRHLWLYTFQFASNNPTRAISHPQLNNRPSGALSRHPQSQTYPFQPLPTFLLPPSQASRPLAGSANRAVGT